MSRKAKRRKKNTLGLFAKYVKTKLKQTFHRVTGVTHFRWISMRDERVRPLHQTLHGKVFTMQGHPTEGYPGQPFNCRCVAEPVKRGFFSFSSLFSEEDNVDE